MSLLFKEHVEENDQDCNKFKKGPGVALNFAILFSIYILPVVLTIASNFQIKRTFYQDCYAPYNVPYS
jgi:hypothetical protein